MNYIGDIHKIYDVVICGGGPAGVAAAISAARQGVTTLLIEKSGFLGGMGTLGLVNPFMNYYSGDVQLVEGIFQEMINNLKERNAFRGAAHPFSFDTEALKAILNEMCIEAGVNLLFHSFLVDANVKDKVINGITIATKEGLKEVKGKVYIDCTGDGDLLYYAGCSYSQGREADGKVQPASLMFRMGGVKNIENAVEFDVPEEVGLPQGRVLYFALPRKGEVIINMTRVIDIDGTKVADLTKAEVEARKQVKLVVDYLTTYIEEFKDSYLIETATQIGIRETRRLNGVYTLSKEDLIAKRKFKDSVAKCNYMIDIHSPKGTGTEKLEFTEGDWYEIPYRCLITEEVNNLIVAGRCISSTHEAHSSLRIQPTCYALGESAGLAAALKVVK